MKAKYKAKQLVDKMYGNTIEDRKRNAITCVGGIIKALEDNKPSIYWKKVIKEIKLIK